MHNMSKIWFVYNNSVSEKTSTINRLFPFFQISNDYCQKSYAKTIFFRNALRGFLWSSNSVTNIFDLNIFDNETTALLKLFEICAEMHLFLYFFYIKEIFQPQTSLLMIHLKCTAVHYVNLNSSSINKPYLRTVEFAILFLFDFLYMFILTRLLSKTLSKNYHFLYKFPKFISRYSILQNITMSHLVILKWQNLKKGFFHLVPK